MRLGGKSLAPVRNWTMIPHLSTAYPRHYTNGTIPNIGYIFPWQWLKYINTKTHVLSYSSFFNYYPINYHLCKFMSELWIFFCLENWESWAVEHVWNVMAHAQKPDLVFQRNGRVHLNWWEGQFSWLLAAEVCASVVVTLDTPCSEVECKTTGYTLHSHVPLHFPYRASPCAIRFQLSSTNFLHQTSYI